MLLLTWHGTLVGLRGPDRALVHVTLPLSGGAMTALDVDVPDARAGVPAEGLALEHAVLGQVRVAPGPRGVGISLKRGAYLRAYRNEARGEAGGAEGGEAGGEAGAAFDQPVAGVWETFLPVTPADMLALSELVSRRWILRDTRRVLRRGEVALAEGFRLRLGKRLVDLARLLPCPWTPGAAELRVELEDGALVLAAAEPRSSTLIRTERWPVRARRQAEMMALAAHRQIAGSEPMQDALERDVAFLLARQGAAGLSDLLEARLAALVPPDPAPDPGVSRVIESWTVREVAPWAMRPLARARVMERLAQLNATTTWAALYTIAGGLAHMAPKPDEVRPSPHEARRAVSYLGFFQAVARAAPDLRTTFLMGLSDMLPKDFGVPVFAFQKRLGAPSLLLPDIDFIDNEFHESQEQQDTLPFAEKKQAAVFAGSTTGATMTEARIRSLEPPRLRAAAYFQKVARVDFRLPNVVQTDSAQAARLLAAQPYCRKPWLSWREQFQYRFVLSMDGNGATCARVAIGLRSHAVLMKYDSEHVLYYFGALRPWTHYVPVARDEDVPQVLRWAESDPGVFAAIAAQGRQFALEYLTRGRVMAYTVALLRRYEACAFLA